MFSFKRSLVALVGVLVLVGTLATLLPLVSRGQGNNPILEQVRPRKFYLTQTQHNGGQALSACTAGYHMASLWEIHDPSNLRYNTELGFMADDSGFGPPSELGGWIRTGFAASADNNSSAGKTNCNAWTSASDGDFGTAVRPSNSWSDAASAVTPWVAGQPSCNLNTRVWCVQD
jgi:hypothetical protein